MGLLSRCTPEQLLAIRDACERDFLAFVALMFRARTVMVFKINHHHEQIVDALMAVYRGDVRNLLINTPPGSSKTELAVIAFMAWCFARNPHCRFLHLSYSNDLASLNSTSAREILETEAFQQLWPLSFRRDTKSKRRWNIESGGRTVGGVYATSTGGQVTGFRAGFMEQGFSGAIIIDDPIKPEDAWSQSKRETANRRMTNTVRSRRATDDTPVIMIMQRVHEEDPSALALSGNLGLDFERLVIEAMPGEGTDEARSYWPDKESLEGLLDLRESAPYTFSSQYQQRPTPLGGAMIKTEWWQWFDFDGQYRFDGMLFATADTAYKAKSTADASVIRVWHGTRNALDCVDCAYGRWEFPELLHAAQLVYERWKERGLRQFFIEDKATGTPLEQTLRRQGVPAYGWRPADFGFPDDKVSRVQESAWVVAGGRVRLPRGAEHAQVLVDEAARFMPDMSHAHDDHVDTLTMAVSIWRYAGGQA